MSRADSGVRKGAESARGGDKTEQRIDVLRTKQCHEMRCVIHVCAEDAKGSARRLGRERSEVIWYAVHLRESRTSMPRNLSAPTPGISKRKRAHTSHKTRWNSRRDGTATECRQIGFLPRARRIQFSNAPDTFASACVIFLSESYDASRISVLRNLSTRSHLASEKEKGRTAPSPPVPLPIASPFPWLDVLRI